MNFKKLIAPLAAAAVLAIAGVPTASAQEAMSPDQQYAYTCGHLGSSCDGDEAAKPRRAKRSCGRRARRAAGQTRQSGRRARCGARRAGARR